MAYNTMLMNIYIFTIIFTVYLAINSWFIGAKVPINKNEPRLLASALLKEQVNMLLSSAKQYGNLLFA